MIVCVCVFVCDIYSDGVGRSGTFICLHSQLERLKTEGVMDFFQAAKSARMSCTLPHSLTLIMSHMMSSGSLCILS